jgi:hypothetical protein
VSDRKCRPVRSSHIICVVRIVATIRDSGAGLEVALRDPTFVAGFCEQRYKQGRSTHFGCTGSVVAMWLSHEYIRRIAIWSSFHRWIDSRSQCDFESRRNLGAVGLRCCSRRFGVAHSGLDARFVCDIRCARGTSKSAGFSIDRISNVEVNRGPVRSSPHAIPRFEWAEALSPSTVLFGSHARWFTRRLGLVQANGHLSAMLTASLVLIGG